MTDIISTFNNKVISCLKPNGKLIAFSDVLEDKPDGPYVEAYDEGLPYDAVMKDYQEAYGMGLGDYGLHHLEEAMKLEANEWFLWPFNDERHMIVKGCIFQKKS